MSTSAAYELHYNSASQNINFVVASLAEKPGRVLALTQELGDEAVQALFDAVMDQGQRLVLVNLLDSPSLSMAVRDRLETFLYGGMRKRAALFTATTLH